MEDATFEILLSKLKDEGGTLASHLVGRDDFVVPELPIEDFPHSKIDSLGSSTYCHPEAL